MKLQQLRILLAVAQHGSIHEASRALHVSQPALSKAIAELERELGVTLLSRSVRGVSLTAYGVALVKRASLVEQELRHALEDIEAIRGHADAELNIGLTAVASGGPLPDAMAAFRQRFPNVALRAFEMRPQQILEGLREGRLDLGLISSNGGPGSGAFQWEPLFSTGMSLAVRAGHPLRRVRRLRPLLDADWLVLDPLDDPGSPLASLMRLHRFDMPKRVVQSASNLLGLQLATRTDLISMWSDFVFEGTGGPLRLDPAALVRLPVSDELPDFRVFLVYRSEDLMTHACAEFSKEVRHCAQSMPRGRAPGRGAK
ncbi:LysR family transcriptional regulator [Cupriavidus sp. 30B13]|uniref:LysR family transcriptional regulator n=1 Tax=Cupriavidus sp. 30B13 TaxID=3384241 RepID=UPI003B9192BA